MRARFQMLSLLPVIAAVTSLGISPILAQAPAPADTRRVALLIFAAQMAWSPWWLARFHFGPAEWLWRSLTYARAQPMRIRRPVPVPAGVGMGG
jgi:uncharacterized membrane protein YeiB